jgi:hypothetical protein
MADDDDFWRAWGFDDEAKPPPSTSRRRVGLPATHRVLLPDGEVVFVFGVLVHEDDLPMPFVTFHHVIIAILPANSLVERWCAGELPGRPWQIVHCPPAGTDTSWVAEHPWFQAAA